MKFSIRWKIILLIILPVVAIFSASILFSILRMHHWAQKHIEHQMVDLARDYARRFDINLQQAARVAALTAAYVEKNPRLEPAQMVSLLEAILENNPLIFGSAVAYDHYAYDPEKKLFIRYLFREGSELAKSGFVFTGYDYTDPGHAYWNTPKITGKASWTEPYYDEGGGNALMCTYSVPFFKDGKFTGITLVDIPLEPIRELVFAGMDKSMGFNIITPKGTFVFSSRKDLINRTVSEIKGKNGSEALHAFYQAVTTGDTGAQRLSGWLYDEPEIAAYAPVESTGWGFSVSITEKTAYGEVRKELYRNLAFFLISLIFILPAFWFFLSKFTRAIVKLNKTVNAFSEGHMDARSDIASQDEIGSLAQAFDHMASRLVEREGKLFETQRLLEFTLEQSPIPILLVGSDRKIQSFNPACRKILGFKDEGALQPGTSLMDLQITWKDYNNRGERIRAEDSPLMLALAGRTTHNLEMKIVQDNGVENWVIATGIPVKDDVGNIIGAFVAFPDITERKKAEEELRESEARFRRIAENAKDMIYRMKLPEGHYDYVSPASFDIFGYTPEEFYETPLLIRKIIHPDWKDYFQEQWGNLQNGVMSPVYEYQAIHKSGETRWIHQRNVLVKNDRGDPLAMEGIVTDLTRAKRVEEEKTKLEADLRQAHKMEAMGTLAGGIAHDFNNILAAIIGYSELAREDIPESSHARKEIDEVILAGKRARDLVKHILAFSRKTEKNRFPVKIQPLAEEVLHLIRATLPSTIEIRKNFDPLSGNILADPTQIHQILLNLCTNAGQAMEENGGILDVSISREEVTVPGEQAPSSHVKLTVRDTGIGIERNLVEKIFDPYFTTKEFGKGSGMGLAVVHGIVNAHQGLIRVESTPGVGTAFHVYFPESLEESPGEAPSTPELSTRGAENILVVDDEKSITDMTRQRLERLGYRATVKTDSEEALALFRSSPESFDLVITDQTMPKLTGEQLAHEMMQIRKDIPIILCTGYSSKMNPNKAQNMGIKAFLMKPVDKNELAATLKRVLDSR